MQVIAADRRYSEVGPFQGDSAPDGHRAGR